MTINWNLPTSWDEVTLATYKRLEAVYKKDSYTAKDVLLALDNTKTMDDINLLTVEVLEKLLETIDFIVTTQCPHGESTNKIEIDGDVYIANVKEKMKTRGVYSS